MCLPRISGPFESKWSASKASHVRQQMFRRNIAEKAIQTFKHHFIAILCGTDETFPMHLWGRLLEQAEHTLNMLRPSRITPKVSAYAYLHGMHSYNANPFAPLGHLLRPGYENYCCIVPLPNTAGPSSLALRESWT